MTRSEQLAIFHEWSEKRNVSYILNFSEVDGFWDVEIRSAAPAEEYFYKDCHDLQLFIETWERHVSNQLMIEAKIRKETT